MGGRSIGVHGSGGCHLYRVSSTSKGIGSDLPDGVKYWKVRAVNYLDVPGAWSSARSLTVDTIAPPAPALSAPANFAPGIYFAPTFSWAAATGANAYMFEYDNNLDFGSPEYTSGTLTTRTILPTGMGVGTWYWHVKSRDAAGNWGELERLSNPRDPAAGSQEWGF